MKIKVIEIVRDGKSFYLNGTSIFDSAAIVDDPLKARNYLVDPHEDKPFRMDYDPDKAIKEDLADLHLKNDAAYARSGIQADACFVTEFEVELKQVARDVGREVRVSG